jgi:hypothetical protein
LLPEEAFLLARRRLGDAAVLSAEFAKIAPRRILRDRLKWLIGGMLAAYASMTALSLVVNSRAQMVGWLSD